MFIFALQPDPVEVEDLCPEDCHDAADFGSNTGSGTYGWTQKGRSEQLTAEAFPNRGVALCISSLMSYDAEEGRIHKSES